MKTINRLMLAGGLALLTGCGENQEGSVLPANINKEYSPSISAEKRVLSSGKITGKILDVQNSSVPFRGSVGYGYGANHPFSYVIIGEKGGEEKLLIYPYSKAIFKGKDATFFYWSLNYGISSKEFITAFVGSGSYFSSIEDTFLEADGIIQKGGIVYDGEKSDNPEAYILENSSSQSSTR